MGVNDALLHVERERVIGRGALEPMAQFRRRKTELIPGLHLGEERISVSPLGREHYQIVLAVLLQVRERTHPLKNFPALVHIAQLEQRVIQ